MQAWLGVLVDWLAGTYGVWILAIASAASMVLSVIEFVRSRRQKVLSCRVRINAPLGFEPPDAGEILTLLSRKNNNPVKEPGLTIVRFKNIGRTAIKADDYKKMVIEFPGRNIVSVDVTEARPDGVADDLIAELPRQHEPAEHRLVLPSVELNSGEEYKLVFLLGGTTPGRSHPVRIDGRLRDNGKVEFNRSERRVRRTAVIGAGLATLLAVTLGVVLIFRYGAKDAALPPGLACASGTLTVEGSSAFGTVATKLAGSYHAYCPGGTVDVSTPGSLEGLNRLRDAPAGERLHRLALADGVADVQDYPELVARPIAVVPYSLVANPKVPVAALTLDQVRRIFTGQASRWSDITGNPADSAEIRVIGRTSQSGSRRTLEKYVLGTPSAHGSQADATSDSCRERRQGRSDATAIVCEQTQTADVLTKVRDIDYAIGYADTPDVAQLPAVKQLKIDGRDPTLYGIRTGYPFWTIEYLYSYGQLPASGSLATSFADYLVSAEGRSAVNGYRYHACTRDDGTPEELCAKDR